MLHCSGDGVHASRARQGQASVPLPAVQANWTCHRSDPSQTAEFPGEGLGEGAPSGGPKSSDGIVFLQFS